MEDNDTDAENDTDWESIGRELLSRELRGRAESANATIHDLTESLRAGEEVDPKDLEKARTQLDMTISLLERRLGPTGGSAIVTEFDVDLRGCGCLCGCDGDDV